MVQTVPRAARLPSPVVDGLSSAPASVCGAGLTTLSEPSLTATLLQLHPARQVVTLKALISRYLFKGYSATPSGRAASVHLGMSTVAFHRWKVNAPFLWPDPRRYPTAESGDSPVIQSLLFCHSALYLFPSTTVTDYHKLGVLQLKMLPSHF